MRRLLATVVLLSASASPNQAFGLSTRLSSPQTRPSMREQSFEGAWVGKTPEKDFQVLLEILDVDNELEAIAAAKDEAADTSNATAFGTQLNLELTDPAAIFKGRLHPDGAQIIGRWTQGDKESWLVFERLEG